MEKRAVAHLIQGKIYIQGYSSTVDGPSCLDGAVFVAAEDDAKTIGENVFKAFDECKEDIPHHVPWRDGPKKGGYPLLKATKCRSWTALQKASKSISLGIREDQQLWIEPEKFLGKHGYSTLKEKEFTSSLEPEELGQNIIKAFALCE